MGYVLKAQMYVETSEHRTYSINNFLLNHFYMDEKNKREIREWNVYFKTRK